MGKIKICPDFIVYSRGIKQTKMVPCYRIGHRDWILIHREKYLPNYPTHDLMKIKAYPTVPSERKEK